MQRAAHEGAERPVLLGMAARYGWGDADAPKRLLSQRWHCRSIPRISAFDRCVMEPKSRKEHNAEMYTRQKFEDHRRPSLYEPGPSDSGDSHPEWRNGERDLGLGWIGGFIWLGSASLALLLVGCFVVQLL